MRDKNCEKSRAFQALSILLVIFFSISLFFSLSLSLSLSLSSFYSLSLHMSFACHKHLDSQLLTSRHAFFQRSIVNFLQRCVNATRANPAESDDGEKKKQKFCIVPAILYIFLDDLILSGVKMVNGIGECYRGDSDGRLSSEVKVTRESSRHINSFTYQS